MERRNKRVDEKRGGLQQQPQQQQQQQREEEAHYTSHLDVCRSKDRAGESKQSELEAVSACTSEL